MKEEAWHWTDDRAGRPVLRDGRPVPPIGEWLVHAGQAVMCYSGLHASRRILDALAYSRCAWWLHRVECEDMCAEGPPGKLVCRRRKVLASADMLYALVEFAEACAKRADRTFGQGFIARDVLSHGGSAMAYARYAQDAACAAYAFYLEDTPPATYIANLAARAAEEEWQEDTLRLWFECITSGARPFAGAKYVGRSTWLDVRGLDVELDSI